MIPDSFVRTLNAWFQRLQGLRIAPPEAPVTGYMFGKGIYFADRVSKSANYCMASPSNNTGLLLLCEVALGDMWVHLKNFVIDCTSYPRISWTLLHVLCLYPQRHELTQAGNIVKPPTGKHSVKGVGKTCPDPTVTKELEDGVVIPLGPGVPAPQINTSLLYNEYPFSRTTLDSILIRARTYDFLYVDFLCSFSGKSLFP